MKQNSQSESPSAGTPGLRFAIAIPVGAWHDSLAATLESLAIQTPRPDVALLDASGDPRVAALADSFGDLFAYRRHAPDAGQSAAIAEGWKALDGDILHWLNVDDALLPGALASVTRAFEANPEADIVYGHSIVLDGEGALRGAHPAVEPDRLADLPRDCVISQPSCFARRTAVERAGGLDNRFHYVMDWDLWTRLHANGAQFHFVNEFLSQVVWGPDTKTADLNLRKLGEMFQIVKRTRRPDWTAKTLISAARQILIDYHVNPIFSRKPFYWRNGTRLPYVNFAQGRATGIVISLDGDEDREGPASTDNIEVYNGERAPIMNGSRQWAAKGVNSTLTIDFTQDIAPGDPIWIRADNDGLQRRVRRIRWVYDSTNPQEAAPLAGEPEAVNG